MDGRSREGGEVLMSKHGRSGMRRDDHILDAEYYSLFARYSDLAGSPFFTPLCSKDGKKGEPGFFPPKCKANLSLMLRSALTILVRQRDHRQKVWENLLHALRACTSPQRQHQTKTVLHPFVTVAHVARLPVSTPARMHPLHPSALLIIPLSNPLFF